MKAMHTILITTLILFGVICIVAGIVMVSGLIGGKDEDNDTKTATDLPPTSPGLQLDATHSSNLTVVLKATAATDPDDTDLVYYWDLGDGTAPTKGTLECTHTYASNGSYVVTLIVTDGKSFNSTSTRIVLGAPASDDDDNDTIGLDGDAGYDYAKLKPQGAGGDDDSTSVPTDDKTSENTIFSTSDGNGVKMAGAATIAIGVVVIVIAIIIIVILVAVVKRKNAAEAAEKKP